MLFSLSGVFSSVMKKAIALAALLALFLAPLMSLANMLGL